MSTYQQRLRLLLFTALSVAVIFFVYKTIVPFGSITYKTKACDNSFFIQKLTPKDRVSGDCQDIIIGDPVYFNLHTPRTFNKATMQISYRTSGLNNLVEIGVLADTQKHYRLQPLHNSILDNLDWSAIEDNGVYLLQRQKQYASIDEFLKNAPNKSEILTYFYELPQNTTPPVSLHNDPGESIIDKQLRGTYQFYTYTYNGKLELTFAFNDLNINKDPDDIIINIYDSTGKVINHKELKDDRGGEETRTLLDVGSLNLDTQNLKGGFYKVEVATDDDIITHSITHHQPVISFISRLWIMPANNGQQAATLYTDASQISISTLNPKSLQDVKINKDTLLVNETYRQFFATTQQDVNKIELARSDVILAGNGVFSFQQSNLYNPNYNKLSRNTDLENINYIITTYKPVEPGEWHTKTVNFNLKDSFRQDGSYGFIISVPGLISDDDINDYVQLGEIDIELTGRSLLEKIKDMIN